MSRTTITVIVIALVALAGIAILAGRYFGILIAEDEKAAEIDPDYDDDDDDYDDDDGYVDNDDDPFYCYSEEAVEVVPISPAFLMKFSEAYIEELAYAELMQMRSHAPHLFASDWYETTKREFSIWSVNLRREYAIAA